MAQNFGDFSAETDLCLAICGFKDIATLKQAGTEYTLTHH